MQHQHHQDKKNNNNKKKNTIYTYRFMHEKIHKTKLNENGWRKKGKHNKRTEREREREKENIHTLNTLRLNVSSLSLLVGSILLLLLSVCTRACVCVCQHKIIVYTRWFVWIDRGHVYSFGMCAISFTHSTAQCQNIAAFLYICSINVKGKRFRRFLLLNCTQASSSNKFLLWLLQIIGLPMANCIKPELFNELFPFQLNVNDVC